MPSLFRLLVALLATLACALCTAETVKLVTYYEYAPWYNPAIPAKGLNAELARRLNAMAGGRYRFEPVYVPRKRLDVMLEEGKTTMVVPWVHPRFFADTDQTRYLWTAPLMADESLIVSARSAPLEYDGPSSLRGKRFAAPRGHLFPDFEPLIASGEIVRVDVPQVINALRMIVENRNLDFTIVDRSILNALKNDPFIDMAQLHVARKPRTPSFFRSILVPKTQAELHAFLNKAAAELAADKEWLEMTSAK